MQKTLPKASVIGENTKTVSYKSNGMGRDAYISYNSGGLLQQDKVPVFFKREHQTTLSSTPSQTPIRPYIPPKVKHYYSDGTGRDKYIKQDDGGFLKSGKKQNYISSLRNYPQSQSPKKHLFSGIPNLHSLPTINNNNNEISQIQKQTSFRLSRPNQIKLTRSLSPKINQNNYYRSQGQQSPLNKTSYINVEQKGILKNQDENQNQQVKIISHDCNDGSNCNKIYRNYSPKYLAKPQYPLPSGINNENLNYIKQYPILKKYYRKGGKGAKNKLSPTKEGLLLIDNVTD